MGHVATNIFSCAWHTTFIYTNSSLNLESLVTDEDSASSDSGPVLRRKKKRACRRGPGDKASEGYEKYGSEDEEGIIQVPRAQKNARKPAGQCLFLFLVIFVASKLPGF